MLASPSLPLLPSRKKWEGGRGREASAAGDVLPPHADNVSPSTSGARGEIARTLLEAARSIFRGPAFDTAVPVNAGRG